MHNNQLQRKDFIERKKSLCSKLLKRQKFIVLCVIFPTDVGWLLNLLWPEQLSVAFYYSFPFPHFCFSIFKSVREYKRTLDFVVLAMFFMFIMLEYPAMTHLHFSGWGKKTLIQDFTVHGPIHWHLNAVSCSLSRKPPKHNNPPPCLTIGHTQHFPSHRYGRWS